MFQTSKIPDLVDPQAMQTTNGQEAWRVLGIMAEFAAATERMRGVRPAVSMFGSARIAPSHPYFTRAETIARLLSDAGFSVISGGGPGLMEAANRGAHAGRSPAIGLNILLPHEKSGNDFQDVHYSFRYFFTRKMMFVRLASAYVILPGGFGTLDEAFEMLTWRQLRLHDKPILFLNIEGYWTPFGKLVDQFVAEGFASESSRGLFVMVDAVEDVIPALLRQPAPTVPNAAQRF
jgi:uncharacterized protein (TIGR00730 family)